MEKIHHRPFFWIAAFFILVAMVVYVMTDNLALRPDGKRVGPVPALTP